MVSCKCSLFRIKKINLSLKREGDVTKAKKNKRENEGESRRVAKGKRKKVLLHGVEEEGRFQSGYIGIYITLLATIFESEVHKTGEYSRSCILLLMALKMLINLSRVKWSTI